MLSIKINIASFIEEKLKAFILVKQDMSDLQRKMIVLLIPIIRERIHVQGLDGQGKEIGTYSSNYLKARLSKNRSDDRKVIFSLTRKLENSYIPVENGQNWGIGLSKAEYVDIVAYLEYHFSKKVYVLTEAERTQVFQFITEEVTKLINASN